MDKIELLHRVRNYVAHAKKIHESTRSKFQMTMEYAEILDNLQFCKSALADLNEFNSKYQIARRIKSIRNQLKGILPNANNPSYQSSLNEYQAILTESLDEFYAIGNISGSKPEREQPLNE